MCSNFKLGHMTSEVDSNLMCGCVAQQVGVCTGSSQLNIRGHNKTLVVSFCLKRFTNKIHAFEQNVLSERKCVSWLFKLCCEF